METEKQLQGDGRAFRFEMRTSRVLGASMLRISASTQTMDRNWRGGGYVRT